jgi:hypothetical protein
MLNAKHSLEVHFSKKNDKFESNENKEEIECQIIKCGDISTHKYFF